MVCTACEMLERGAKQERENIIKLLREKTEEQEEEVGGNINERRLARLLCGVYWDLIIEIQGLS